MQIISGYLLSFPPSFGSNMREFLLLEYASGLFSHHRYQLLFYYSYDGLRLRQPKQITACSWSKRAKLRAATVRISAEVSLRDCTRLAHFPSWMETKAVCYSPSHLLTWAQPLLPLCRVSCTDALTSCMYSKVVAFQSSGTGNWHGVERKSHFRTI